MTICHHDIQLIIPTYYHLRRQNVYVYEYVYTHTDYILYILFNFEPIYIVPLFMYFTHLLDFVFGILIYISFYHNSIIPKLKHIAPIIILFNYINKINIIIIQLNSSIILYLFVYFSLHRYTLLFIYIIKTFIIYKYITKLI